MIKKNFALEERKRFLKVLTLYKVYNVAKCYFSFYISKWLQRPLFLAYPFTLSFEPTTKCNLSCPECPSGLKSFSRNTGNATLDLYKIAIDRCQKHLLFLYLYFQGEPLIHKDFGEMIRIAKNANLFTVTSTNGHYLTPTKCRELIESGLDRLLISIDGSTQEVYEQYRRDGQLAKVIEGTKNLIAARKQMGASHPYIVFQMLVVAPNEHQIEEVHRLSQELEVDELVLKTAQVYDYQHGHPLIPHNPTYARYKQLADGTWRIKNKLQNQCWKMWHSAVSTWDGDLLPCCFDKDATYRMGNITQHSLSEIWHSTKYQDFRNKILKSRKEIDICTNCSEGTKVWETI